MPKSHFAALVLVALSTVAMRGPVKRAAHPAAPSARCVALAANYDDTSKTIAANSAEGMNDNSAIRATMRETQNNTALSQARLTIDLMRSNNCKVPDAVPNVNRYIIPAMECQTAILKDKTAELENDKPIQGLPDACDQTKWKPYVGG